MKNIILSLIVGSLAAGHAVPADSAKAAPDKVGLEPDGAYVVKIERPFDENAPWLLPLDIRVRFQNGQGIQGAAFAMNQSGCWHPTDVSKLRLADAAPGTASWDKDMHIERLLLRQAPARAWPRAEPRTGAGQQQQ